MNAYIYKLNRKIYLIIKKDGKTLKAEIKKDFKLISKGKIYNKKEFVKILKKCNVFVSNVDEVKNFLLSRGIKYKEIPLCEHCLIKNKITILKDVYKFGKRKICKNCAEEELKRELDFKGYKSLFVKYKELLHEIKDVDRVVEQMKEEKILFDTIKADEEPFEMSIDELKITEKFKEFLKSKGIKKLYPVQALAVKEGLLENKDLLVVSATASGKTLIAELAGIEKALNGKKMLYLVPLVALANQKYEFFKEYEKLGLKVAIKVGRSRIKDEEEPIIAEDKIEDADIIVGTYEAIDKILRSGNLEKLKNLGTIVVDEVHVLGDEERGIELDGLIARLRYFFNAQFIALSATVPNYKEISDSYGLKPIAYMKRPIPLERYICITKDKGNVIKNLVIEEFGYISKKGYRGQSIVFTNSRRKAHEIAEYLSKYIPAKAYHAGLSYIKRKEIESLFANQMIACVVTTAALSLGIDFPASQIIFESLSMGNKELSVRDFNQMLGRAGRPLFHEKGKVFLIVYPEEVDKAVKLLSGKIEDVFVYADEDSELEQILACVSASKNLKNAMEILDKMYHKIENVEKKIEKLEKMGLMKNNKLTSFGKIVSLNFLKPSNFDFILKNKDKPVEYILSCLEPFENAYLNEGLRRKIQTAYKVRVSTKYFEGIGIIYEEPKKEFLHVIELVNSEFLKCNCKDFPYCDHAKIELSKKIINLRKNGMNSRQISKFLGNYFIEAYSGDIFNWLDGVVRKCEALEKIFSSLNMHKKSKYTRDLKKKLEG